MVNPTRKELIAIAKAHDIDFLKLSYNFTYSNYFCVYNNGTLSLDAVGRGCYGNLSEIKSSNNLGHKAGRNCELLCIRVGAKPKKLTIFELRYFKWLFNDSPYAPCFVTKKGSDLMTGPCILDCNFDPRFVTGAAQMVRQYMEYPHIIKDWNRFRCYVSGNMAFVLAIHYRKVDGIKERMFRITDRYSHTNLDNYTFDSVRIAAFVANKPIFQKETMAQGNWSFLGTPSVWGLANRGGIAHPVSDKTAKGGKDSWGTYVNIAAFEYSKINKGFLSEFLKRNQIKLEESLIAK